MGCTKSKNRDHPSSSKLSETWLQPVEQQGSDKPRAEHCHVAETSVHVAEEYGGCKHALTMSDIVVVTIEATAAPERPTAVCGQTASADTGETAAELAAARRRVTQLEGELSELLSHAAAEAQRQGAELQVMLIH